MEGNINGSEEGVEEKRRNQILNYPKKIRDKG